MSKSRSCLGSFSCLVLFLGLCGISCIASAATVQLTVKKAGTGAGTVTSSPGGVSCGSTCTANFTVGTSVKLTAAAASGSKFASWSGGCTGTSTTCTISMTAAKTVTATFDKTVQLTVMKAGTGAGTVTSSPAGVSCGSTCTAKFTVGTSVKLTAAAASGSKFASWSGGCTGTNTTCTISMTAGATVTATFNPDPATTPVQLTVDSLGTGTGTVISTPAGIDCPQTCAASFPKGTAVVLTAAPDPGITFAGWSGLCTGIGSCKLTLGVSTTVSPTFEIGTADVTKLQHIIFFAQENRSLDNYFGAMRQYWQQNGIPDQSFDGLPQFNPPATSGLAPPFYGPPPSIPGCNPNNPPPSDCIWDPTHPVTSFHLKTVCNENTSPSWNEAHVDWNFNDQVGRYPAKNNGFVKTAGHDARTNPGHPFFDVNGIRAMGYWDGIDLNFYYYMATKFATSDRFFHPELARSEPNREYLVAATSGGYTLPNGANAMDTAQLKSKVIFQALQDAGISWKVYVNPVGTGCAGPPYQASCLIKHSYLSGFTYAQTIVAKYPQNIASIDDYYTDLANGTLPQVAEIPPASDAGLDEHGSVTDSRPGTNIQKGANYTRKLVTALMGSSSWSSSAFILTFDESGGMYDHVAPQPTVNPDGIAPVDIPPNSVCYTVKGPTCDFVYTGYRIPLIVISPYAKQNYVSHTVADFTAILKLIETRFLNGVSLTKRDAAQIDMTEFFDFNNPPWMSPPSPPAQNLSNPCYLDRVP